MKLSIVNQLNIEESVQKEAEEKLTSALAARFHKNLMQLGTTIPNLVENIKNHCITNHSFIVNKNNELNLLIKSDGLVVYPYDAKNYTSKQLEVFFKSESESNQAIPTGSTCLVIIGIGLGYHLLELAEKTQCNFIILYEPETDFLKLSLYTAPWFEFLIFCNANNIQLFIQYGSGANNLNEDIAELQSVYPDIKKVLYYRHFSYKRLDQLMQETNIIPKVLKSYDLHPYIFPKIYTLKQSIEIFNPDTFNRNLHFLEKNNPEIAIKVRKHIKDFGIATVVAESNYEQWEFGDISLRHEKNALLKDPLIYGLTLSKKNIQSNFLDFLVSVKSKIDLVITDKTDFNKELAEIILFGVLDSSACLSAWQNAKKLIVVEKKLHRFITSCFTTPWFELSKSKPVYFLIDEEASLEKLEAGYLRNEFSYIDSFIYQPYFTRDHKELSFKLLESIQSTNGKNNHFEAIFNKLIRSKINTDRYPILRKKADLSKSQPVIIIGNGPSLEEALSKLKKLQGKVLLISCGTTLGTLLQNDIIPDFHIELEKEDDTLARLDLLPREKVEYITLIATPEIHSGIPKLFEKTILANATSNPVINLLYEELKDEPPTLEHSYYTVTNYALDLMLQLNFKKIFLVGVDFGFPSIDEHHAHSSYYFNEKGKSVYDYELQHGATMQVASNLDGIYLTVPAFNAARILMEQCIAKRKDDTKIYNVGDGAKITGTETLITLPDFQDSFFPTSDQARVILEQHFTLTSTTATKLFLDKTLIISEHFCRQLLTLWSSTEKVNNELSLYVELLAQQEQLLAMLQQQSQASFELFNGSCRYFSMLCYRYLKTSEAMTLIPHFVNCWHLLLSHFAKKLDNALHT